MKLPLLLGLTMALAAAEKPIPVKVVVVSMFERGADTGDQPGEFQFWVEREKLDKQLPFPAGWRNLRMNKDGVLGLCTGIGTARAAASVMALGLDPRFDLRKAYWLVAGIAGIDPADGSLGSAAWAEWVVDGDLGHEIDAREIPAEWKTGMIPLRKSKPYEMPRRLPDEGEVYQLNPALTEWAFQLTKDLRLDDSEAMKQVRSRFAAGPAHRPPFVLKGDTMSSGTFWHGQKLNEWANDWVKYHTDGKGNYVTTAMEDTGTLQSLTWLAAAGKVPFIAESERCRRLYQLFVDADYPRAFAASGNGRCGYAWGGEDPRKRAIDFCRAKTEEVCKLYAIDDEITWRNEATN